MDPTSEQLEKLSATKPLALRPGVELADKINALVAEVKQRGGQITYTDILRDGLLGCWTDVRAHLLIRHTTPPANADDVARCVAISRKVIEHGVPAAQVEEIFDQILESHLAASRLQATGTSQS